MAKADIALLTFPVDELDCIRGPDSARCGLDIVMGLNGQPAVLPLLDDVF